MERKPLNPLRFRGQFGFEERIRIQEERKNKPSKIVAELQKELHLFGNPLSNTGPLFTENLVNSVARSQQSIKGGKIPTLFMDTITCPLYRLESTSQEDSEFAGIHGIYENLENSTRYQEKFLRYLITFAKAKNYFIGKGIILRGRVYFGDAGIIHAKEIKDKYGLQHDYELRQMLMKTGEDYHQYFKTYRGQFGLDIEDITFNKLSNVVPELLRIPLDLGEAADSLGVINGTIDTFELQKRGISSDVIGVVRHEIKEVGRRVRPYSIAEKESYREIVGFLLTYGFAGKAFAKQEVRPDIFVSLDKPAEGQTAESYRHSMYFAFLPKKGSELPVFIPKSLRNMRLGGIDI